MSEAVVALKGAFGKRAIVRRHLIAGPDGTATDRVRYLAQLRDLNDEFLEQASTIILPGAADESLRNLVGTMRAATTLVSSFISDQTGDFDSVVGQIEDLEEPILSAFLDLLTVIDPSVVSTVATWDDDSASE